MFHFPILYDKNRIKLMNKKATVVSIVIGLLLICSVILAKILGTSLKYTEASLIQ